MTLTVYVMFSFAHSSHGTVPSEMLESWNMVSKAWWISANEGRSNGLHCQPGLEKDLLNVFSYYQKLALTWNGLQILKERKHFKLWNVMSQPGKEPHEQQLTCSHEFIDFGWTSFWLLHTVTFLQEVVHLRQVDSRVWRHAIGGNFP